MEHTDGLTNIKDLLPDLKKRFKVFYEQTLFPPEWKNLKDMRCPFCANRLHYSPFKKIYLCKGRKHLRTFVLKESTFKQLNIAIK